MMRKTYRTTFATSLESFVHLIWNSHIYMIGISRFDSKTDLRNYVFEDFITTSMFIKRKLSLQSSNKKPTNLNNYKIY